MLTIILTKKVGITLIKCQWECVYIMNVMLGLNDMFEKNQTMCTNKMRFITLTYVWIKFLLSKLHVVYAVDFMCVDIWILSWVAFNRRLGWRGFSVIFRAAVWVDAEAYRFIAIFMIEICLRVTFFCVCYTHNSYSTIHCRVPIKGGVNCVAYLQTQGRVNQRPSRGWVHKMHRLTAHTHTQLTSSLIRCRIFLRQLSLSFSLLCHTHQTIGFICSHGHCRNELLLLKDTFRWGHRRRVDNGV